MSFIETPRFPDNISYGATGGPEYKTDIVSLDSGAEQRNIRWDQARARYTVEMPLTGTQRAQLIGFFRSVKAKGHGFRLKDWSDYQVDATTGRVGLTANGTGLAALQLYKYYAYGALEEYRLIKKPVIGTVQIYRGGVLQVAGAGAGQYALDTTTGIVTFVAAETRVISGVTIAASAVLTLSSAFTGLIVGGKIYVTGVVGTAGAALNNLTHTITVIAGSTVTISTSTLGTAYTSGGLASKFPQANEALYWTGEFDVPARFDVDYLPLTIEAPAVYRAQQITLIEIR